MSRTRTSTRTFALFLLTLVVALQAGTARAGEADDPEQLIRTGNDLRRKGDNVRAFGYLQRAYDVARTPRSAAQLGLCEQALGRFPEAEVHLSEALVSNDAWVDANRASLDTSRVLVRKHLSKVMVTGAPAGTTVAVGSGEARKLSEDGTLWVVPGQVTLSLAAPGYRGAKRSATATENGSTTVVADLVADAPTATSVGTSDDSTGTTTANPGDVTVVASGDVAHADATSGDAESRRTLRLTGLAVGGAGVGIAVAGFWLRHVASNKLAAIDNDANATPARPYNPDNGNWKTFDNAGLGLLAAGGAAVVTGAVLYLVNREPDDAVGPSTAYASSASSPWLIPNVALTTDNSGRSSGAVLELQGLF